MLEVGEGVGVNKGSRTRLCFSRDVCRRASEEMTSVDVK